MLFALPGRPDDGDAGDRRLDRHALGVALGLPHRVLGAVAANLEDLDVGVGGAPLQVVGLLQLLELGLRLLERQRVLLGLDLRQHLVLERSRAARARARSRPAQLAVVLGRARRGSSASLLANLLLEIVQLGAAIERVAAAAPAGRTRPRDRPARPGAGRDERVMTRELLFWPARRGVEIVVASTASTVPDRRTISRNRGASPSSWPRAGGRARPAARARTQRRARQHRCQHTRRPSTSPRRTRGDGHTNSGYQTARRAAMVGSGCTIDREFDTGWSAMAGLCRTAIGDGFAAQARSRFGSDSGADRRSSRARIADR